MARLEIEPLNLHWLYDEEPVDLCAHGGVRVNLEGRTVFLSGEGDGWSVSTASLHLLRTLEQDYVPSGEWGQQLIPCCGNFMGVNPETGAVENCGCPSGIDWRITHQGDDVHLELDEQTTIRVSKGEWRHAVERFSERVRAFYFDPPRKPDADDAAWFAAFVAEWDRRQAQAGAAP